MTIENAHVLWRDDGLPYSSTYNDIYFSRADAEGESRHVFLDANNLSQRWRDLPDASRFTIAELGFGSGLNFLLTAQRWESVAPSSARLHYIAFEKHPLTQADIRRLHALWPHFGALSADLLAQYPDHSAGCHRLYLTPTICLDLHYGDAQEILAQDRSFAYAAIDCWYLDGFSPALNPALWSPALLSRIGELSHKQTTLSTYSVAGAVRQGLSAAGFDPQKLPGFGRKRHMLFATRSERNTSRLVMTTAAPWLQIPAGITDHENSNRGHAVIIGAGLAGCSTAYALAQRGWQVTVLERAHEACAGASGISQLALRCRIFKQPSAISAFFTHGFLFANRHYKRLQATKDIGWHPTGILQLTRNINKRHRDSSKEILSHYADAIFKPLTQHEASDMAGLAITDDAWHLPLGGWIAGAQLCESYLAHPSIQVRTGYPVQSLQRQPNNTWRVIPATQSLESVAADVVVIANAGAATDIEQCNYLPLQQVRGQISQLVAAKASAALRMVVTGERTVFPLQPGQNLHTVAASYDRTTDTTACAAHDAENLTHAQSLFEDSALFTAVNGNQVAVRCNSVDRMPIVGALADSQQVLAQLKALSRNASHQFPPGHIDHAALYYPGLFINVAHGSNGAATCPLSAELLASLIDNEALPCAGAAVDALNPIRFLIRELKQQKHI